MTLEGPRLTVTLHEVPLDEALREIARQTGLRIVVHSALDDRLSVTFADLTVEAGLKRLVGRHPVLLVYTAAGQLEEVRVYPFSPADSSAERPWSTVSPEAVPALDETLAFRPTLTDPEPAQRLAAIVSLAGTHEADEALGIVLDLLGPSAALEIRERALGILTFFEAVPVDSIIQVALFDPEPSLRVEAAWVLSRRAEFDLAAHTALRHVAAAAQDETLREEAQALLDSLDRASEELDGLDRAPDD